jgi:hypothetical protein
MIITGENLAIVAGIFLITGYVPYIYEVFRGTDIPSRMSWLIWSLSTAIILIGVRETGTIEAIWVPIADAVGCFAIFILSFRYGTGGWGRADKISLAIVAASLLIWWYTGDALIALVMNLLIYVSGYISTIAKAIKRPRSESVVAWSIFLVGVILNLIAVMIGTDEGFAVWLYPIVLICMVGTLYYFLTRRFFYRLRKA